ncbi:MAG: hypothetical protein ABJB09_05410 [Verrucomicrobiota bacterium]
MTAFFSARHRLVAVVVVILAIYAWEAHARRQFNPTPASQGDQGAYLAFARQMQESGYTAVGERNRMPVFPFLLSLIHRPGVNEEESLARAQAFNVNLSILLLLLLFFFFRKVFPPFYAVALLVSTAFGVFLYRAPLAQCEVLFYCLTFCAFFLLARMLVTPRWWVASLSGIALGAAYLTKASILPAIALWSALFAAQTIWQRPRRLWQRFGLLALVLFVFLVVIFPYIRTSKQLYGQYFFNVNSAFVMWCDSAEQEWAFFRLYQAHGGLTGIPSDQIPSPANYWRQHSLAQMAQRLAHGVWHLSTQHALALGYYKFLFALAIAIAILCVRHWRRLLEIIAQQPFAAVFCLLFPLLYLLLFAWYEAIVSDTRFTLMLFLPVIFSASVLALRLGRDRSFAPLLAGILISLALIDIAYNGFRALP